MAYEGWQANVQAYNDTLKMVLSYECGGRQPDDSLRDTLNGTRIDLSKVGCSNQPFFLASYNEIVQAREGKLRREKLSDIFRMNVEGAAATPNAAIWFVLVNGLGLLFLCARTVVRWVHRGLQEYLTSHRAWQIPLKDEAAISKQGTKNEMDCVSLFLLFQHCGIGT